MAEPVSDEVARNRFVVINLVRLAGVIMTLTSMLILADVLGGSYPVGYVLLGLGLVAIFAIPQLLARKWRSPPE